MVGTAVWAAVSSASAASASPALVITTPGEQAPISARIGAPISIAFDYAGGTGFAWLLPDPLPIGMRLLSNESTPAKPGLSGGPVRQTITFAFDAPSEARVTLAFRRSWLAPSDADAKVILKLFLTQ